MAGRKVEGNHKIVESQEERTPAEELIAQQNNTSEKTRNLLKKLYRKVMRNRSRRKRFLILKKIQ